MRENKHIIIFWADASVDIGTGHIYRCLTLAEELRNRGANISFICKGENGSLIDFVKESGYYVYPLPANIGFDEDLRLTKEILRGQKKCRTGLQLTITALISNGNLW